MITTTTMTVTYSTMIQCLKDNELVVPRKKQEKMIAIITTTPPMKDKTNLAPTIRAVENVKNRGNNDDIDTTKISMTMN